MGVCEVICAAAFVLALCGCHDDSVDFGLQAAASAGSSCDNAVDRAGLRAYATQGKARIAVGIEIEFYVESLHDARQVIEQIGGMPVRSLPFRDYAVKLDQRWFAPPEADAPWTPMWSSYRSLSNRNIPLYYVDTPKTKGFLRTEAEVVQAIMNAGVDYEQPDSARIEVDVACALDFHCALHWSQLEPTTLASPSKPPETIPPAEVVALVGHKTTSKASVGRQQHPELFHATRPSEVYQALDRARTLGQVAIEAPRENDAALYNVDGAPGPMLVQFERQSYPSIAEVSTSKGLLNREHLDSLRALWRGLQANPRVTSQHPYDRVQGLHISLDLTPYAKKLPLGAPHVSGALDDAGPLIAEWILLWSEYRARVIQPLFRPHPAREFYAGPVPSAELAVIKRRRASLTLDELIELFDGLRGEQGVDFRLHKIRDQGRLELTLANADLTEPFDHVQQELDMAVAVLEQALQKLGL